MKKFCCKQYGFTLIEVMLVLAMLAILSTLALPSYREYVIRGEVDRCFNHLTPALMSADALIMANDGSTDVITGLSALGLSGEIDDCEGGIEVRVDSGVIVIEGNTNDISLSWSRSADDGGVWGCSSSDVSYKPGTCT